MKFALTPFKLLIVFLIYSGLKYIINDYKLGELVVFTAIVFSFILLVIDLIMINFKRESIKSIWVWQLITILICFLAFFLFN